MSKNNQLLIINFHNIYWLSQYFFSNVGGPLQTVLHLYPVARYLVYKIRPIFSAIRLRYASDLPTLSVQPENRVTMKLEHTKSAESPIRIYT